MKVELIESIGDGGFADVWKAKDELGRIVAVKIIRKANVNVSDALSHAKALARADHENVVKVYSIDKVNDPVSGDDVDAVIMEFIDGKTLETFLEDQTLSITELRTIGLGIINGISHIHDQGLTHGDLHEANIMIKGLHPKVIDILYLNSLATMSTLSKEAKFKRDLVSLRLILQQLMHKSELIETIAKKFNNDLDYNASILQIREVFFSITSAEQQSTKEKTAGEMYDYLMEDGFVDTEKYAVALYNETPNQIIPIIFQRLINELKFEYKHTHYVRLVWKRLSPTEKNEILQTASQKIDIELPNGKWSPILRLIQILGKEGWSGLNPRIKIKAEALIIKDVLAGYIDIHSVQISQSGSLGTYSCVFWESFEEIDTLIDNIVSLLRQGWYSQNYIGTYFMDILNPLAMKANRETEVIDAIRIAINNDAKRIVESKSQLPQTWLDQL